MEEKTLWRIVVIVGEPLTQEDAGYLQEEVVTLCETSGYEVVTILEPDVNGPLS